MFSVLSIESTRGTLIPWYLLGRRRLNFPYASTWLDYCSLGYLLHIRRPADAASVRRAVDMLADVRAEDVQAKRAALRAVGPAFQFRDAARSAGGDGSGPRAERRPSAADYILNDVCAAARGLREPAPMEVERDSERPLGQQCLLSV